MYVALFPSSTIKHNTNPSNSPSLESEPLRTVEVCANMLTASQLMKKGDEETINGQAELVASLDSSIKSMSRSKQKLSIFATKVSMARQKQSIGAGMLAVSKALGRVTDSIQLERVEQVMDSLEKQYEDIDVMTAVLDDSTSKSTARDVPLEEVERVKRMVADEAGLELSQELNAASAVREEPKKVGPTEEEEDRIRERLRALRERQVAS